MFQVVTWKVICTTFPDIAQHHLAVIPGWLGNLSLLDCNLVLVNHALIIHQLTIACGVYSQETAITVKHCQAPSWKSRLSHACHILLQKKPSWCTQFFPHEEYTAKHTMDLSQFMQHSDRMCPIRIPHKCGKCMFMNSHAQLKECDDKLKLFLKIISTLNYAHS